MTSITRHPEINLLNGHTFPQKTYVKEVLHRLIDQGSFGVSELGGCMYRGKITENGKNAMCAVGIMMPDAVFQPDMEGKGARVVLRRMEPHLADQAVKKEEWEEFLTLNSRMQRFHDSAADVMRGAAGDPQALMIQKLQCTVEMGGLDTDSVIVEALNEVVKERAAE